MAQVLMQAGAALFVGLLFGVPVIVGEIGRERRERAAELARAAAAEPEALKKAA